jgi:hypothetical protein
VVKGDPNVAVRRHLDAQILAGFGHRSLRSWREGDTVGGTLPLTLVPP